MPSRWWKRLASYSFACVIYILNTANDIKNKNGGLQTYFSNQEHFLFLQRTWVQFLAPVWWLVTICNSTSRRFGDLLWPSWVPGTRVAHIHPCRQNTHIHKNKVKNKLKTRQACPQNERHYWRLTVYQTFHWETRDSAEGATFFAEFLPSPFQSPGQGASLEHPPPTFWRAPILWDLQEQLLRSGVQFTVRRTKSCEYFKAQCYQVGPPRQCMLFNYAKEHKVIIIKGRLPAAWRSEIATDASRDPRKILWWQDVY